MFQIFGEKVPVTNGLLEKIEETDGCLEFEWKITKFFSGQQPSNYRLQSPKFEFLGAESILCLNSEALFVASYNIEIVCKLKDGSSDLHTKASIEMKCFDGTVYKSVSGPLIVRPHTIGDSYFTDVTPKLHFAHSDLLRDNTKIAPQGVLTISCCLGNKQENREKATADSTTQTEISEGIHADAEVTQEHIHQTEDEESSEKYDLSDLKGIIKLGQHLKNLLTSGEDNDVVMKVGDKEFPAHRAILRVRSTVFSSMFRHDMKERACGSVEITDCDPQAFEQFLLYVYTGKVDCLSIENVCQLYQLSDKYDIQDLKTECVEYMKKNLSADNFCTTISLALQHNESALIGTATQFFVKNSKKIVTSVNWLSFLKEKPVEANVLTIKALNFAFPD